MNPFVDNIRRRQAASFGGLKIVTRDAHVCTKQLREGLKGDMLLWSVASGICKLKPDGDLVVSEPDTKDPFELCLSLNERLKASSRQLSLVLADLDHWLEGEPVIRRHVLEAVQTARTRGHLVLTMSRHAKLHPELADELTTIYHPLPDRDASRTELERMLKNQKGLDASGEQLERALDAVQGLTSSRQADAFSLGVVDFLLRKKEGNAADGLDVDVLRRYKEEEIAKLAFMKVSEPEKSFADLMGHEAFKTWLRQRRHGFFPEAREHALPVPRGMLLVGPPGTGKSRLAEATAHEWGIPFLTLDVGSIFGSMLGESEANVDMAIEIAERMAPCVLLVDEVERAFGGDKGGGDKDGGTTDRVIGKFLTWMAAKKSSVFVVFTSNEASNLPAQMIRKGRLDGIFFVDFPTTEERKAIFNYYLSKGPFRLDNDEQLQGLVEDTKDWSGAEIEAAIGDARYTAFEDGRRPLGYSDIQTEIKQAVPVSTSMKAQIDRMREWAKQYARATHAKPAWAGSAKAVRNIEV